MAISRKGKFENPTNSELNAHGIDAENNQSGTTNTGNPVSNSGVFIPRSRGKIRENELDADVPQNSTEGPMQLADRKAKESPIGFRPNRTAEPLDGDRKNVSPPPNPNLGYGPQGEYDIDSDNLDRSSVPRNPKDSRPDQQ